MKPESAIVAATGHGQHARNLELESLGVAHLLAKPYETQIISAPYIYVAQLLNFRSEKGGQLKLARATTACARFAAIA